MALIAHKYMPAEMPEAELKATFAAREHTLDYLLRSIAEQTESEHLTSFLITGPRGSGKTTLALMLRLRIREDAELGRRWLPVLFPEELPAIGSLRDLLSAALDVMSEGGFEEAARWRQKVEAEEEDRRSERLAARGLEEITKLEGKRLILIIENLDMVFARGLDAHTQKTLRRLLMTRPFMMIIGTAVRMFEELESYDAALFNYFCPVPLRRLGHDEVERLLRQRAEFDGGEKFAEQYRRHRPKIRAISKLTGGNPRLILMLYEVLMHGDMSSTVGTLRQMIDELTPLLKDVLEHQMSAQQAKIVDALMRAGGVATPSQLATTTRLSQNTVTTQLKRLLNAQILEVRGGGKGKPAYYSVADKLFSTWYQMRYLRPRRRRIEMFVEVFRIWYEVEERWSTLKELFESLGESSALARSAVSAEYLAASLAQTEFEVSARDLAVFGWVRSGHLREAAESLAEFATADGDIGELDEVAAFERLADWSHDREDLPTKAAALEEAVRRDPQRFDIRLRLGWSLGEVGDYRRAIDVLDLLIKENSADKHLRVGARFSCALARLSLGEVEAGLTELDLLYEFLFGSQNLPMDLNDSEARLLIIVLGTLSQIVLEAPRLSYAKLQWIMSGLLKVNASKRGLYLFFMALAQTQSMRAWLGFFRFVETQLANEARDEILWLRRTATALETGFSSVLNALPEDERYMAEQVIKTLSAESTLSPRLHPMFI